MSTICYSLHSFLQKRPEVRWPFALEDLPRNGIYFFYEAGETWGHGGTHPRIVRVGSHREGNFRARIADHYVINERKMAFNSQQAAPKDRSIFRKNIGRALLHRNNDPYLAVWDIDFTIRANREMNGFRRDIQKERHVENEVSRLLREKFSFRWIELADEKLRLGSEGLEASFIGTLGRCSECHPSANWLGRFSPKPKIAESGLWLEQHLGSIGFTEHTIADVIDLVGGC